MTTRAKFNVTEVAKSGNGGGAKVSLSAVVNHSEENKEFWEYTPAGTIEIWIDNPKALAVFEGMGEFYVDFTKAED